MTNWFSAYCGLGGEGPTEHATDELCKQHDEDYQKIMEQDENPYWNYNWADEKFIEGLNKIYAGSARERAVNMASRLFAYGKQTLLPKLQSQFESDTEGNMPTVLNSAQRKKAQTQQAAWKKRFREVGLDENGNFRDNKASRGETSLGNAKPRYPNPKPISWDVPPNMDVAPGWEEYAKNSNMNPANDPRNRKPSDGDISMGLPSPGRWDFGTPTGGDDSIPDLSDLLPSGSGNGAMDIDNGQDPPQAEARMSSGPGNPQSKETLVSPYPTLPFGLQETHTTILPWTGWVSAVNLDYSAVNLRLRMNGLAPISTTTINGISGSEPSKGIWAGKAEDNDNPNFSATRTFPTNYATSNQVAWSGYWAKLYQQYTVLGCEYKVIIKNARSNQQPIIATSADVDPSPTVNLQWATTQALPEDRSATVAYEFDSSTSGDAGNIIPDGANYRHLQQWKGINWENIPAGATIIIQGRYKPGQIKRMVLNDGDVKTWYATNGNNSTGWTAPALKDDLNLMFFKHPFAQCADGVVHCNIEIQLKWIVQFKDLVSEGRYPAAQTNITHGIPNDARTYA